MGLQAQVAHHVLKMVGIGLLTIALAIGLAYVVHLLKLELKGDLRWNDKPLLPPALAALLRRRLG